MHGAPGKAGQATCKAILSQFDMEYLTRTDMDWVMQQLERYQLSHGVGIHDCLIASVCHRLQVPLYTHNVKDMRVLLDVPLVIKPY
jgi:predicted nucleic acid-binding protein